MLYVTIVYISGHITKRAIQSEQMAERLVAKMESLPAVKVAFISDVY